jgi:hypothetical protein
MRHLRLAILLSLSLAIGAAGGVIAAVGGRSSLTEAQIRTGELNCLILDAAVGHGLSRAQLPDTTVACRLYLLTLRRP